MSEQTDPQNPVEVDPSLDSPEAAGLTPAEQIIVLTLTANAAGASQWSYSLSHADAAMVLREVADQIDLKAAAAEGEQEA